VIKDHLLSVGPVVGAWIVGGLVIFAFVHRFRDTGRGRALEALTTRQAFVIGVAQVLALWPGTSRSLITILAGLLVGLSLSAAVEFSFLLGLVTLGAATAFELLTAGGTVNDAYGVGVPALGVLAALVSAVIAVRWMVAYLNRHDLSVFGWYRLAIAAVTVGLLLTGVI
jgi:undecaprenyl-diphosphatase